MFSIALLSVTVEYMPEKMTSILTAFPARMLFHSESGNSGTRLDLRTIRLELLRSRKWFCTRLGVSSWLWVRTVVSASSLVSHAKSDSSGEHFLEGVLMFGDLE